MHARAAVFDLYGDHLVDRGGWAPISAIVRLLEGVDVAPSAARTAVSRMAREGWLAAQERDGIRGYLATPRAQERLESAWERIYAAAAPAWDGRWHIVVTGHVADRSRRARLAASLGYLGYGRLSSGTWIAPRASHELSAALDGVPAHEFRSRFDGDGRALARSVWDLDELAASYRGFCSWLDERVPAAPLRPAPTYGLRALIVHEWRKFLFDDPGLPAAVLPTDWPGADAAGRFLQVTGRLRADADSYVEQCLAAAGAPVARRGAAT